MKKTCAFLVVVAVIACGCSKPEDKFVAKWEGRLSLPQEVMDMMKAAASMATPEQQKQMADGEKQINDLRLNLDLQKGGKCTITTTGIDENETSNGAWSLSEDGKTLTIVQPKPTEAEKKAAMDKGVSASVIESLSEKNMDCVVSADMNTLTFKVAEMGVTLTITFVRK